MFQDHELIEADPAIMMGKPVVRGTRITVETILRELAGGQSVPEIIDSYPQLDERLVRAALLFAADSVRLDIPRPVRTGPAE
jgi:uncharacterized protein (DUF433 family)